METLYYRVLGICMGEWCIEEEGFTSLKEARTYAKARRGPYKISRLCAEVIEEGQLVEA